MSCERVQLSKAGPEVSRIAAGCWRLLDWGWGELEVEAWMDVCHNVGITTFDHADIYGDYRVQELFGRVLRRRPDLRNSIQIVTKCDIRAVSDQRPENQVKSYDTSARYIASSVEGALAQLHVDHLDVVLLHRPDPLMDADEVAEVFDTLRKEGKVGHFGVSNFAPSQYDLLASRTPLVTNQVEHSLLHTEPLFDGTFDQCQQARIRPMLWSPMGGGALFRSDDATAKRLRSALQNMALGYGVSVGAMALAWLLREPVGGIPIMSSSRGAGISDAVAACDVALEREDWFILLEAARGEAVA